MTPPPSPKNSKSPKTNPAFPNPDVPHINTHPIITLTLSPPQLPNHHSTPQQLPKPTSPPYHSTKNSSVSSSQNRAHGNTLSLATWKRIPRPVSQEAVFKSEPLGQKRAAPHHAHQSELPSKKYMVSQIDNENILILAEAGSQPCQEQ